MRMKDALYFRDNFFSAGTTEVYNSAKEKIGELDLKSAFSSGINVLDPNGKIVVSGKFGIFSNKWRISDGLDQEIGLLTQRFSLLTKKYEYEAYGRGVFVIESEAFSRHYEIFDEESNCVATFEKVNGFFSSPAYQLTNNSDVLSSEELMAIVMGTNAIQKRRRNANNAAAGS
jgi:hypothetical protein